MPTSAPVEETSQAVQTLIPPRTHTPRDSPATTYTPKSTRNPETTVSTVPTSPTICSPLANHTIAALEELVVNPYQPPPPGYDRPHQGVDLAVLEIESDAALQGESVQAILSGRVSAVIKDRFPYGNAILVETPLRMAGDWQAYLDPLPTPWEGVKPDPALTCPVVEGLQQASEQESIYILYAHLLESPSITVGTELGCGEYIGRIGMSGNALNPHVHIEARLGPTGVQFESLAHYDSSASAGEMSAYCQWRVSGTFQHFDPMSLLQGRSLSGGSQP